MAFYQPAELMIVQRQPSCRGRLILPGVGEGLPQQTFLQRSHGGAKILLSNRLIRFAPLESFVAADDPVASTPDMVIAGGLALKGLTDDG